RRQCPLPVRRGAPLSPAHAYPPPGIGEEAPEWAQRTVMTTLLLRHARLLITMNDAGDLLPDGALFVRDGWIEWTGRTEEIPAAYQTADRVIDATDHVVLPGLVNTHHHLYQTLTRAIAPNNGLFDWL